MTTLVLDEVRSAFPLIQEDTIRGELRTRLRAVRLHLIGVGNPLAGSLKLSLKKGLSLVSEKEISLSEIKTNIDTILGVSENHWHGYVRFEIDDTISLERDDIWTMELIGTNGYNFSDSSYIGWVKPHEDFVNSHKDVTPTNPFALPFGYQLWKYKR